MYKIGEQFVYGSSGACKIVDIKNEKFSDSEKTYYILSPFTDMRETIFVPVDNEKLVSKMKRILSPDEINSLIKAIPSKETMWIENVNLRREEYKKIISSTNREALISLIKTLYVRRKELQLAGKSLSVYDEKFLKQAQNIIHSEIAIVLKLSPDEVEPYIEKTIHAA